MKTFGGGFEILRHGDVSGNGTLKAAEITADDIQQVVVAAHLLDEDRIQRLVVAHGELFRHCIRIEALRKLSTSPKLH